MAVDTRNKRASSIFVGVPFLIAPNPDGTISVLDRGQAAYCYAGITPQVTASRVYTQTLVFQDPTSLSVLQAV